MLTEGEVTCIHHMIQGQGQQGPGPAPKSTGEKESLSLEAQAQAIPWESSVVFASVQDEKEKLIASLEKLSEVIDKLSQYVDDVVNGREEPNVEIGMAISNAIDAADVIRPEDFHSNFQVSFAFYQSST